MLAICFKSMRCVGIILEMYASLACEFLLTLGWLLDWVTIRPICGPLLRSDFCIFICVYCVVRLFFVLAVCIL